MYVGEKSYIVGFVLNSVGLHNSDYSVHV